jgi:quercetin dioxygenase-like cupin family protein
MQYRWDQVAKEQMDPRSTRQAIHGKNMTVARFEISKGGGVPTHHHPNEQISLVQSGRVKFILDGAEWIVGAGEVLEIPPNVPHSGEALEDAVVVELFSPPREDWIKK